MGRADLRRASGAGPSAGRSSGVDAIAGSPARRGCGDRSAPRSATAGAPCSRRRREDPRRPADAEHFTSPPAQPGGRRRVGLWLGICFGVCFLTGLVSHYAQKPAPAGPVPGQPGVGLPGHPGPARHHRHRRGAAAAGQALDGLPAAVPAPAAPAPRGCCVEVAERGSIARARRGVRSSSSRPGLANSRAVVPVGLLVPDHPLRVAWVAIGALVVHVAVKLPRDPPARSGPTSTTPPHDRPAGDRARGRCRGAGCCAPPGSPPAWPCSRPPAARVPLLRDVSVLGVRSGDGPRRHPDQQVRAGRRGHSRRPPSPAYRLDRRRTATARHAEPRTTCWRCRRPPRPCRSRASRAGARAATWTGVRVRDAARPGRARPPGSDVAVDVAAGVGRVPAHDPARPTSPTTTAPCSRSARRRGAVARPRLPVPADRAQPAGRAADQVGRPDGGARDAGAGPLGGGSASPSGRTAAGCCSPARTGDQLVDAGHLAGRRGGAARRRAGPAGAGPRGGRRRPAAPGAVRAPAAVALVVLGSVTLLAVPVLGRLRRPAGQPHPARPATTSPAGWSLVPSSCSSRWSCRRTRRVVPAAEEGRVARVLVVDDDPTVREVVVSYLRAHRHDVGEAARRRDARWRSAREHARRPRRARPDAAGDRRPRGVPAAARGRPTCR